MRLTPPTDLQQTSNKLAFDPHLARKNALFQKKLLRPIVGAGKNASRRDNPAKPQQPAKMQTATIARDEIPAIPSTRDNQHWLTVPCPQGWDDVRRITDKVLRFASRSYVFRGWNSDRNEAYFLAAETAKISNR